MSINWPAGHKTGYPHSSCAEGHKEAYIPVIQRLVLGDGVVAGIAKGSAAGGLSLTDMRTHVRRAYLISGYLTLRGQRCTKLDVPRWGRLCKRSDQGGLHTHNSEMAETRVFLCYTIPHLALSLLSLCRSTFLTTKKKGKKKEKKKIAVSGKYSTIVSPMAGTSCCKNRCR